MKFCANSSKKLKNLFIGMSSRDLKFGMEVALDM